MSFDYMFNPRSIAVVGASSAMHNAATNLFIDSMLAFGYKGKIYPINPNESEVRGLKVYANVRDVPGPVDVEAGRCPIGVVRPVQRDLAGRDAREIQPTGRRIVPR